MCKTCWKVFSNYTSCSRHKSSCGKDKTYDCTHCKKMFARKDARDRHMKVHRKSVAEKGDLLRHEKKVYANVETVPLTGVREQLSEGVGREDQSREFVTDSNQTVHYQVEEPADEGVIMCSTNEQPTRFWPLTESRHRSSSSTDTTRQEYKVDRTSAATRQSSLVSDQITKDFVHRPPVGLWRNSECTSYIRDQPDYQRYYDDDDDDFDEVSDYLVEDADDNDIDFNMLVDELRNYVESGCSIFDRRCQSILATLKYHDIIA